MSTDVYTEPFDFALYPFALGDTLTWCVRSAIRALEAGKRRVDVMVCVDPERPHCAFQDKPNERQYQLVFSEVLPAFYTHPLLRNLLIFHDRAEFDRVLDERRRAGSIPEETYAQYRAAYAQRDDLDAVTGYFLRMLSEQAPINQFYEKTGSIPWLREVLGCQADVDGLIRAQGEGAQIVTVQFRLRNLDKAIAGEDFLRDVDYQAWESFLIQAGDRHPRVRFMLLGRLQEKPLNLLRLPNVVAPRLLGLTLAHELSLLMRSHAYVGSSSGFAQGAHFSRAPYRIFNISQSACATYGVPFGAEKLPFALPNQRLVYGKETAEQLLANLGEALAEAETDRSAGTRTGLAPVHAEDATTFRFIPDLGQAKYEMSVLCLSSLARIKHNLKRGEKNDAIAEVNQLHYTLAQVSEQYSTPAAVNPVLDELARYETPTLRELARYWGLRLLRQPYFKLLRLPGPPVDFAAFTSTNSHAPAEWIVNGTLEPERGESGAGWRFRKDHPNSYLKSKPFPSPCGESLRLVFQAKRPQAAPMRSKIYLFEDDKFRVVASPLYTPFWQTYCFDFVARRGAALSLQFDNNFQNHWLHLRNVRVGSAAALTPATPANRPAGV